MFYSEQQVIDACLDEPSTIFSVIKNGDFEMVEKLIDENITLNEIRKLLDKNDINEIFSNSTSAVLTNLDTNSTQNTNNSPTTELELLAIKSTNIYKTESKAYTTFLYFSLLSIKRPNEYDKHISI